MKENRSDCSLENMLISNTSIDEATYFKQYHQLIHNELNTDQERFSLLNLKIVGAILIGIAFPIAKSIYPFFNDNISETASMALDMIGENSFVVPLIFFTIAAFFRIGPAYAKTMFTLRKNARRADCDLYGFFSALNYIIAVFAMMLLALFLMLSIWEEAAWTQIVGLVFALMASCFHVYSLAPLANTGCNYRGIILLIASIMLLDAIELVRGPLSASAITTITIACAIALFYIIAWVGIIGIALVDPFKTIGKGLAAYLSQNQTPTKERPFRSWLIRSTFTEGVGCILLLIFLVGISYSLLNLMVSLTVSFA